jgi:hypothetical protein
MKNVKKDAAMPNENGVTNFSDKESLSENGVFLYKYRAFLPVFKTEVESVSKCHVKQGGVISLLDYPFD